MVEDSNQGNNVGGGDIVVVVVVLEVNVEFGMGQQGGWCERLQQNRVMYECNQ